MPHIHTGPGQHDHTVSAYIVRLDGGESRLMLHRHRKLGVYMQFGGHIELDETPWQAITHELREESGYELDQLAVLQPTVRLDRLTDAVAHPLPFSYNTHPFGGIDHFHTDAAYAFVTQEPPRCAVFESESADIRLFTKDDLLSLSPDEIYDNVRVLSIFILEKILPSWEQVPAHTV